MTASHRCFWLLLATSLLGLCGASCPQMVQRYTHPPPRLLPPSPTVEQVVEAVNRNSAQIHSFSTSQASISGPGFPSLGASVAFERSKRFRLRAGTGLTGTEFDLGSNDELFWFWLRRNEPQAVFFCRHDQFASCPARRTTPLEPGWLIEALGVVTLDPSLPHQLSTLPNDKLRIDTILNTPEGPVTKITILDGSQGWVLEQHLFDARRQLLASSVAAQHRRDPLSGLVMPKQVSINWPAAQFSMRINLGNVEINRLPDDSAKLWSMPSYPGAPLVDLADPKNFPPQPTPQALSGRNSSPQDQWRRPVR